MARKIDEYSYRCGVIDAFNEIVAAGVKRLALSHPCASAKEREELLQFSEEICKKYGTSYYVEDELLTSDLFAVSESFGKYLILYYRDREILEKYRELKERKRDLCRRGEYCGEARRQIALDFAWLLSYEKEAALGMIEKNQGQEDERGERRCTVS